MNTYEQLRAKAFARAYGLTYRECLICYNYVTLLYKVSLRCAPKKPIYAPFIFDDKRVFYYIGKELHDY